MLYSLRELNAHVIFYDLGITAQQFHSLVEWPGLEVVHFDFRKYPVHVNINVNAGEYAWKPIILYERNRCIAMKLGLAVYTCVSLCVCTCIC